jgi:hypothetical protein
MENWNSILDDNKENSYSIILGNVRRRKLSIYLMVYGLIIGAYLWGGLDVMFFSGILFLGIIFSFYEIIDWKAIYHISTYEACITLYLLDFWGRKNEIDIYEKDLYKIKLNHSFNSIQIPVYDLQLPLEEKKFKILVEMIQNLDSRN